MKTLYKILFGAIWLLILYLLFPLLSPFARRPIVWIAGDRLDWASRRLAGWNTQNCGWVPADGDAREAANCVLSAVRNRTPFRVRYDLVSVDAGATLSLVGTPDGRVYQLSYLSRPFGGSIFGDDVATTRCKYPIAFHPFNDMGGRDRGMIGCIRDAN